VCGREKDTERKGAEERKRRVKEKKQDEIVKSELDAMQERGGKSTTAGGECAWLELDTRGSVPANQGDELPFVIGLRGSG
jgi:hypothetical protein